MKAKAYPQGQPQKWDLLDKCAAEINRANFLITAVQDITRQQIISLLIANGKNSAEELCEQTNLEHLVIAGHLWVLRKARLITIKRSSKNTLYSIDRARLNCMVDVITKLKPHQPNDFAEFMAPCTPDKKD